MKTDNGTKTYDKIEALRKRKAAVEAALVQEIGKQQKAEAKSLKREFADVGEMLCTHAKQSPGFHAALKEMVTEASVVSSESTRNFLRGRAWTI